MNTKLAQAGERTTTPARVLIQAVDAGARRLSRAWLSGLVLLAVFAVSAPALAATVVSFGVAAGMPASETVGAGAVTVGPADAVDIDTSTLAWDELTQGVVSPEDIDAFHIRSNGNVLFSTKSYVSNFGGLGLNGVNPADVIEWDATQPAGSEASVFFSAVGVGGSGSVNGVSELPNGNLLLTTAAAGSLPGLGAFSDSDIVEWDGTIPGASLYLAASTIFASGANNNLDAIHAVDATTVRFSGASAGFGTLGSNGLAYASFTHSNTFEIDQTTGVASGPLLTQPIYDSGNNRDLDALYQSAEEPPASLGGVDIPGIQGPVFTLSAGSAYITTPDGDTLVIWAYGDQGGATPVQYPGPTLIVNEGDTVEVTLTNSLTVPTSIIFPGQGPVTTTGGSSGLLTAEAAPTESVTYSFVATNAGTYTYHSGTQPDLQVEMGLLGVLIVRPTGYDQQSNRIAYGHADTAYKHEYLMLLSEMDPVVHDLVDFGYPGLVDNTGHDAVLWFINGRNAVDTLSPPKVPWQPHQPYDALIRMHPGEKVLLRFVGGGRDLHPLHPHGNHSTLIARDGRMLESAPGEGPDLATADFTFNILPGATYDAVFDWTGERLGWDIYGNPADPALAHDCNDSSGDGFDDDIDGEGPDMATHEWCADHGVPIPVALPGLQDITFGGFYSGDSFLGSFGNLPPGEGGLNLNGGLFFPAHSHNEKELTNNDIFLGGMLTFIIIEPPWVEIP